MPLLFPGGLVVKKKKNLPANARDAEDTSLIKLGQGNRQPTPIFLPGKSHGQKEPGGLQFIGLQRARCDLVTEQQQHPSLQ